MVRRPTSLLVDTDIFIDYLNGVEKMREILDSPSYRIYYSVVTKKELLARPGLSATERRRIGMLLLKHRRIPIDEKLPSGSRTSSQNMAITACEKLTR